MTDFSRIDRVTASPAYREYASLIGAALARAAMAASIEERRFAFEEARQLQAEQARLVRGKP